VLTGLLVLHNESQHDTPTAILKKMFAAWNLALASCLIATTTEKLEIKYSQFVTTRDRKHAY
jgi:hypothetical protein